MNRHAITGQLVTESAPVRQSLRWTPEPHPRLWMRGDRWQGLMPRTSNLSLTVLRNVFRAAKVDGYLTSLGAKGKLTGTLKSGLLVEVGGRFATVSNKMLDRISVRQKREIAIASGDRLHLKANRKLAPGGRVTIGELVAVKSVRDDGSIELADGRVLDASFREFLTGYAVTSYGSQGKTVDPALRSSCGRQFLTPQAFSRRRNSQPLQTHEHKITRMLGERSERSRRQNRSVG